MCKKQTAVSHSSTESEIISLDAGLRLDGITALDLWDLIRLGLFQDSDFAGDLEDWKPTSGVFFVHIWKSNVCSHSVGCARNKLLCHTVRRNLRLSLLMQVYAGMGFTLWMFGICLLKCCILLPINLRMCRETCCMRHHQENTPRTKLRLQSSTTNLNYATSIMFPQMWSLLTLVRCSTFFKIMRHVSRTHRVALDRLFDR